MSYDPMDRPHNDPTTEKTHQQAENVLQDVFEDYLEQEVTNPNCYYEAASDLLEQHTFYAVEAHDALHRYNLDPDRDWHPLAIGSSALADDDYTASAVGRFLSAAYNHAEDDVIVFDDGLADRYGDAEGVIGGVGEQLDWEKTLVVRGHTLRAGRKARGLIINHGTVHDSFGAHSSGIFINNGVCDRLIPNGTGPAINTGVVRASCDLDERTGDVVAPDAVNDDVLTRYLTDLEDRTAADRSLSEIRDYLTDMDPTPAAAINQRITAITGNRRLWSPGYIQPDHGDHDAV